MFKSKLMTCMLVAGLTVGSSALAFAGSDGTEGNEGLVDNTNQTSTATGETSPAPGGEPSDATGETSGEATDGSQVATPEDTTDGSEDVPVIGDGTESTEATEGEATEDATESTETDESSTELPQTGVPALAIIPALGVVGGAVYFMNRD